MKALVTRIIRHEGRDYRLIAGQEAPPMPPTLGRLCQKNGYIEAPPGPAPEPRPARVPRKPEGEEEEG